MSNVADRVSVTRRIFDPGIGLALLCAICMVVTSCSVAPPVVKIGLVGPFTGRHRDIGYDVIYSARLAIREINESGGIGRNRVALVALDDFGDPELARKNALALSRDPAVVAVIGHWLPETTRAANSIYVSATIPFVVTGVEPFGYQDPELLPSVFRDDYADLTPFEEVAGPYAGSAYDAVQLIIAAMEQAENESGTIDRETVLDGLENMTNTD
jgi:ABC-type branched-subunit amino acid transport system substrate-binding protein